MTEQAPDYTAYFELFKKEAGYWLSYFGLFDWRVTFYHDDLFNGNLAETRMDHIGKVASMVLAKNKCPDCYSEEIIKRTAFHEACELMLSSLYCIIESLVVSERGQDMMYRGGHEIIRRLENTVYRDLGSNR